MNTEAITMVRIYVTEGKHLLNTLLERLHDQEKVCGVTVFRGVAGFGRSGQMHSSTLVDLSMDLPLVVEFFDRPERVEQIIQHLERVVPPGHIVSWSAFGYPGDQEQE